MEKQESIFRKKSLDRVSSPEQLDNYLKVTKPSVWLILVGIIIILVGVIVWGVFSEMKTYVVVGCVVDNGTAYCYANEENHLKIKKGMIVEIPSEDIEFEIENVNNAGMIAPDNYEYLKHLINVSSGDYIFESTGKCNLKNNLYEGKVVVEVVSPLSFIFN